MNDPQLDVIVVDDDPTVLSAIVALLESAGLKAIGIASVSEFLAVYGANRAGCLVLDLTMPDMGGLDLQQLLREAGGGPPIVFLSGTGDIPSSVSAMKLGAVDFLTKPVEEAVLLNAVQKALESERITRRDRLELDDIRHRFQRLTPREREVFAHVVSGQLNKQIAMDLGAAEKTIKIHRGRVMEKLEVDSLAALVHVAECLGIDGGTLPNSIA
jgi:FixJ family two-component response regulator